MEKFVATLKTYEREGLVVKIIASEHEIDGKRGMHIIHGLEPNEYTAVLSEKVYAKALAEGKGEHLLEGIFQFMVGYHMGR